MMIQKNRYPNGAQKAVTFSFDIKLIQMMKQYGLKGTFHLNSGMFGDNRSLDNPHGVHRLTKAEVQATYGEVEIAVHTLTHPHLETLSKEGIIHEIYEDRKSLEAIADYPVQGMSYPYGTYNQEVIDILKTMGICYSRTISSTHAFDLPEDFLTWHPSFHYRDAMAAKLIDEYLSLNKDHLSLLYIWGHSFELDKYDTWDLFEQYCAKLSNQTDIWYVTNIEIYRYMQALDRLIISCDQQTIYNPSHMTVCLSADDQVVSIKGGEVLHL